MYKIEKKDFGFKLTFGDFMKAEEMTKWLEETKKALLGAPSGFGVFVDMRTLVPLPSDAQGILQEGQKLYKQKGMTRSAVVLNSATITSQFKRLAQESGIYAWERYIDASKKADWETVGITWLKKGTDPDK
jgi:hypothetical protein